MMRPTRGLSMAFAWIFILFLGLPVTWFGTSRAWTKMDAVEWTPVTAEVLFTDSYLRTGKQVGRCVRIRYAYTVAGRKYESRSVATSRLSDASCERNDVRFQQRWGVMRPGLQIRARYDPGAPERAILVVETLDFMDFFIILLGLVVLATGGWELRRHLRP